MLDADRVVLMLGDALFTVIPPSVPVIVLVAVSVAVIDWVPAVLSVTPLVKASVPAYAAVKPVLAGNTAFASLLLNFTVPR